MATIRTYGGKQMKWQDQRGMVHAAEGYWLVPEAFCLWTVCEKHDVPANAGFTQDGLAVTCPDCAAKIKQ